VTVLVRHVAAAPVRSASITWDLITDLLAPSPGSARSELQAVSGVACALIASEAPKCDPIIAFGDGPRIRVYCLFGEDARAGDDKDEDPFAKCPTNGDWHVSLPCSEEDFSWVQEELKRIASHVSARKFGEQVEESEKSVGKPNTLKVNKDAFFRP
jgi:hypothetical protein